MHRVLVVANQTICGKELREELRKRVTAGQCSFYVLVPNTAARHYHVVPAAAGFVPMPTYDSGPATDSTVKRTSCSESASGWSAGRTGSL